MTLIFGWRRQIAIQMETVGRKFTLIIIGMVALLWGCGTGPRKMMPTPNVYLNEAQDPYHALNPDLKSTEVRLFYVTDRGPEKDKESNLPYGYNRSASLAFGDAVVDLGKDNYSVVQFVGASGGFVDKGDGYGHSYFRNAPTVNSDLVLMLRDDRDPGIPERPLEHIDLNFCRIPPGYPAVNPAP